MKWSRKECQDHSRIIWDRIFQNLEDFDARLKALEGDTPATAKRTVSFTVNDGKKAIQGATVKIGTSSRKTGSSGGCKMSDIEDGTYTVTVTAEDFVKKTETITVDADHTSFTISLTAE